MSKPQVTTSLKELKQQLLNSSGFIEKSLGMMSYNI
jgi:hypothetical protein